MEHHPDGGVPLGTREAATPHTPADVHDLIDEAVGLARRWLAATENRQTPAERATTGRLAALVADPAGLDLAVRFVDRVARPEDVRAAARDLARIPAGEAAGFLGATDRLLLGAGAKVARLAPRLVVPLARRRLRQLVGHLVIDARDPALGEHLARSREQGFRLNLNLLGEAVLGEGEAASRTARTRALLERTDVDYVSVKVSSLVSQISTWDTPGTAARVLERLRPLYRTAAAGDPPAFVNLDMEEYRDLDLTLEVFTSMLAEFPGLRAGLALQAYLPDSVAALDRLAEFARERASAGGAPIKVRLVKGANLSMEQVDAELHGWAQAPYATKAEVDANYVRLVERALRPELVGALRLGVASHNLYDVALAHLLAGRRGMADAVDVEMLQGMNPAQARAVRDDVGSVLLYTPVVAPEDFDVAVSYLVRRLEENAQPQNFLHALFAGGPDALDEQEERFRRSVPAMATTSSSPRRDGRPAEIGPRFANTLDADPALPQVRAWAEDRVRATPPPPASPVLSDVAAVEEVVARAVEAAEAWSARPPAERAGLLRRAAQELQERRGELVTAMTAEGGKTVAEADPEVSEAIDFARYYADRAEELDPAAGHLSTDGARFTPARVTVVTPPWNFPVAIPIGGVLAALAAGSAVVIKPAPPVPVCTEVAVAALHAAGVPDAALQVVRTDEAEVGQALVSHADVERVVLTGAAETADMFLSWRSGRVTGPGLLAETSGKNALVITPAADYDLAVADLVRSAFGHAGQKCSAASLAILVGSAGRSERLLRQLVDAVRSVRVGWPTDLGATMGPVIEPPTGKLHRALTTVEPGERWLVEPRQLDATGRLWSPGVKDGVAPGSFFHLTECFGPVLGLMRADTLEDALELQNATAYGLTGGLHSLDEEEIARWCADVAVGNAYVNRHITGAIVQRQSFGGWKASVVGPGAKAGGPNYVAQLGTWSPDGSPTRFLPPAPRVQRALEDYTGLLPDHTDRAWLRAAVGSDAAAWHEELGRERDLTGLRAEANVFRYRPAPVLVRATAAARPVELLRVLLAAELAGTPARVSLDPAVSRELKAMTSEASRAGLRRLARHVDRAETAAELAARVGPDRVQRLRVVGEGPEGDWLVEELHSVACTVLTGPVLATGRRELLSVLREQAISRTLHRFGHLPGH